jgi:hypothetical protein
MANNLGLIVCTLVFIHNAAALNPQASEAAKPAAEPKLEAQRAT